MLNEKVCLAYANNSSNRRPTAERWSMMFESMPIGEPLTATEIAEKGMRNPLCPSWWKIDYREATQMLHAMLFAGNGCIKREEIAIDEPYEFEIKVFKGWEGLKEITEVKKITIDHKTVFTRLM